VPGLFTPVRLGSEWLVDGGLVNPIPVSVCRALVQEEREGAVVEAGQE
jgi:NTE family protein